MSGFVDLLRDVVLAWRRLRRAPWSTFAVVFVASIGIAGVTTVFSVVNTAWLRPLPYEETSELTKVVGVDPQRFVRPAITRSLFDLLRRELRDRVDLAAFSERDVSIQIGPRHVGARLTAIDSVALRVLRVAPALGRAPTAAEHEAGAHVVMVGDGFWRQELGGTEFRPGFSIGIEGEPHEVIGVMPAGFHFDRRAQLWSPFGPGSAPPIVTGATSERNEDEVSVVGRLATGTSREDLQGIAVKALRAAGDSVPAIAGWRVMFRDMQERAKNRASRSLAIGFFALATVLLLVASLDAANLLRARALRRRHGLAIAFALGATQARLMRGVLLEHAILALLSGLVGLGLTVVAIRALAGVLPVDAMPGWVVFGLDERVLVFTAGLATLVMLALALVSVREFASIQPAHALADVGSGVTAGHSHRRRGSVIVRAQVVFSLPLVVLGSTIASVHVASTRASTAEGTERAFDVRIELEEPRRDDYREVARIRDRVADLLGADPRVELVARFGAPLEYRRGRGGFVAFAGGATLFDAERPGEPPLGAGRSPWFFVADSAMFAIHGQATSVGRSFASADSQRQELALIVEASYAAAVWEGQDPVGRRVRIGVSGPVAVVIGIVEDRREPTIAGGRLVLSGRDQVYLSRWQVRDGQAKIAVRSASDVETVRAAVVEALAMVDSGATAILPLTVAEEQRIALLPLRLVTSILLAVSLFAHALSLIGLFGLVGLRVAERYHELGIRTALGATHGGLVRLLIRSAASECAGAVLAGAVLATTIGWSVVGLTELPASGIVTIVSLSLVAAVAVMFAATFLSAARILRQDPVEMLRESP